MHGKFGEKFCLRKARSKTEQEHQCSWGLLARMVLLVLQLCLATVTTPQTLRSNRSEPHSNRSDPSEGRLVNVFDRAP